MSKYIKTDPFRSVDELFKWSLDGKPIFYLEKCRNSVWVLSQQILWLYNHLHLFYKAEETDIMKERLTTRTSIMGNKHDLLGGLACIWKKKLKNDKYYLIEQAIDKLGKFENIEEWIKKLTFYSKNYGKIKFKELDFRPEENNLLIHFDILKNGCCVFYSIYDYGKNWSLRKQDLE